VPSLGIHNISDACHASGNVTVIHTWWMDITPRTTYGHWSAYNVTCEIIFLSRDNETQVVFQVPVYMQIVEILLN